MAKKTVYQNFDADALTHFGLDNDPLYGVLSGSYEINEVLCTQDQNNI